MMANVTSKSSDDQWKLKKTNINLLNMNCSWKLWEQIVSNSKYIFD